MRRREPRDIGDAGRLRGGHGGRQPGRRLADAGHAGRLAGDADQLPRRPGDAGERRTRGRFAQWRARRRAAGLLHGHRRELPAVPPLLARRAGQGARQGGRRDGEHELHDRPPGDRERARVPDQPRRSAGGAAFHLRALADPLGAARHDRRATGRDAGRPVPRPLPGPRHGGTDDRGPGRQPRVVSPAPRRRAGGELRRAELRGQTGARVVAGAHHRRRLRPGPARALRQLLPARGDDQGRQRLPRRPARAAPDAAGHGLDRCLRPRADEPLLRARRRPRRADRLGDTADRCQDGPRDVGVACARPHPSQRVLQPALAQLLSVGFRAHELGRSRKRRGRAAVGPQHVGPV